MVHILEFERSPLNKGIYRAYKNIKRVIKDERYDLVHTHTPVTSTIVRLACRRIKNTKVFYTAHEFHFFKGAPLRNWLIYYPIEKWLSSYTDVLITINHEYYNRAKTNLNARKVEYIPGIGLDISKFKNVKIDKNAKLKEISVPEDGFVVLSVGELNKNKNHEVVIRALAKLDNPKIHYLICGKGSLENYLKDLVKELGLGKNAHILGFRIDIGEIYKNSDLFLFPSQREGLPVPLMEAMASGLPVVCSDIRGNKDLIENGKGGYLVNPNDADEFLRCINILLNDTEERLRIATHNMITIESFKISKAIEKIQDIYLTNLVDVVKPKI